MSIQAKLRKIVDFYSAQHWLTGFILFYIIVVGALVSYKYYVLGYNALDLSIINQAFYNTAHGAPFASSIHPSSYLGDHFSPILLLLLPFYVLLGQSAWGLVIIQVILISLGAMPLYLIAKKIWSKEKVALLAVIFYLFNPVVLNAAFYEFHFLSLVPLLGFGLFYFWLEKKYWPFFLTAILLLLVREDMALVLASLGIFIFFDDWKNQQKINWAWLMPIFALSAFWLVASLKIIAYFNPDTHYKFFIYYSWLGNGWWEILQTSFLKPGLLLKHFLTIGNLEMVLGLLLSCLFLPLLKPHYWWLSSLPLLPIILGAPGGGALIFQTHYALPLMIGLFVSSLYAAPVLLKRYPDHHNFILIMAGVCLLYTTIMIGPNILQTSRPLNVITAQKALLDKIPAQAGVVASYEFLPALSSRPNVVALNYVFIGQQQYSQQKFTLSDDIDYAIINFDEILTYQLQYWPNNFYRPALLNSTDNLQNFLITKNFRLVEAVDSVFLLQKNTDKNPLPINIQDYQNQKSLADCQRLFPPTSQLDFSCDFQNAKSQDTVTAWQVRLVDNHDQTTASRLLPIAYGLADIFSPSRQSTRSDYHLSWPQPQSSDIKFCLDLVKIIGGVQINASRGLAPVSDSLTSLQTNCFTLDDK